MKLDWYLCHYGLNISVIPTFKVFEWRGGVQRPADGHPQVSTQGEGAHIKPGKLMLQIWLNQPSQKFGGSSTNMHSICRIRILIHYTRSVPLACSKLINFSLIFRSSWSRFISSLSSLFHSKDQRICGIRNQGFFFGGVVGFQSR